ncbi:YchF/TatD family DNA exonuclease [Paenibacillus sp. LMG 31456]|uniref:YchF/TatD family DNA exonuclease n=1 Tax=Paenibacillus foliorum TaxID=2654974 RepID=A0A972GUR9_9BACL|nr:TatD family hydrolase [Paenibacillus foliorum]NOU94874.1 YchF/TatD family DNA exonuclease [Paenibacillus foliorum]
MNKQMIDIGVNLMHRSFQQDRDRVVARAVEAGVSPLILTGTHERNSEEAARYAARFPEKLYATAGIHPHDARNCTAHTIEKLHRLALLPQVVAIGECGLDYNRDFSPRDVQKKWFEEQVQLACELKIPLFLHEREAHYDFIRLLKPYAGRIHKAVVHCFTGSIQELQVYLNMGFYIGITGWICDERRGKHLREVVKRVPLNRLMIETDAPFLTPRDLSVKPLDGRNEPAFLPHIAQAVAACVGKTTEEVADITTKTAKEFFDLK